MAPVNDTPTVAPTSTSEGYRALFIDRFSRYTSQSSACGFFYRFNDGPHCRIEAADIRLEFVDVREFGRGGHTVSIIHSPADAAVLLDPEGTLFYNNLSDLNGAMDYRFWVNSGTTDDEAAVVAQFYKKGGNTFVAEVCSFVLALSTNDPSRLSSVCRKGSGKTLLFLISMHSNRLGCVGSHSERYRGRSHGHVACVCVPGEHSNAHQERGLKLDHAPHRYRQLSCDLDP